MDLMVIVFFKLHKHYFIKLKYNMKNIKIIGLKEMKLKFKYEMITPKQLILNQRAILQLKQVMHIAMHK